MLRFFRDPQTKEFLIAGTGPAAHRSRRLEDEEALPHRSSAEGAQGSVPRDHSRQGRRAGTPQEADRRPRPVRRLQDQDGAAAARRRVRVRQRHFRRRDSQELHSRRRKGNQGRGGARLSGGISRWWISESMLYDGSYHDVDSNDMSFQMAGRIAFKKAMEAGQAHAARAGHGGRDHGARRICRHRSWAT